VIVLYELYIDSLREKLTLDVVLDEEAPFIMKVVGVDDYDVSQFGWRNCDLYGLLPQLIRLRPDHGIVTGDTVTAGRPFKRLHPAHDRNRVRPSGKLGGAVAWSIADIVARDRLAARGPDGQRYRNLSAAVATGRRTPNRFWFGQGSSRDMPIESCTATA
jgi:hypothetical protein